MIDLTGKRISRYARVSTDDKGQTPENQFIRMDYYCERHRIKDFIDYQDEQSGKSMDRPGWNKLKAEMESHAREGIMVTYPDRYSRNLSEAMISIEEILSEGKFIIFTESGMILDEHPLKEDMWLFLANQFMQAEYYRRHLSSNTRAGLERVKREIQEKGSHISRTGRTIERVGRPAEVTVYLEDILKLKDEGKSLQEIADELGSRKSTIYNILKRQLGK